MHLLHAADLHLGTPLSDMNQIPPTWTETIKTSSYKALERLVDAALEEDVDGLLLAGDIYDSQKRNIKAQYFFYKQMKKLEAGDIPVFIAYGNHDYVGQGTDHIDLPSNCHVFPADVHSYFFETSLGETVVVTGFSYDKRWMREKKILDFPSKNLNRDYHIAVMHGQVTVGSEENDYAPFHVSELERLAYDYFALGHVHQQTSLSNKVAAYYSGCLSGRNRKEVGNKGYLDLQFSDKGVRVTPISVSPLIWQELRIVLPAFSHWQEALEKISEEVRQQDYEAEYVLLDLKVCSKGKTNNDIQSILEGEEFLRLLRQDLLTMGVWPYQLDWEQETQKDLVELRELFPQVFDQERLKLMEKDSLNALQEDLRKDPRIFRWLKYFDAKGIIEREFWPSEEVKSNENHKS